MQIQFGCGIDIDIKSSKLEDINKSFLLVLQKIIREFYQQVINAFADDFIKELVCDRCKIKGHFKWKTHHGKPTLLTLFIGILHLNQLQVQCCECSHKMYITRKMLGIEPRKRIPADTVRKLGLIGALTTYRVASKITGMFGVVIDKMTIWKSVQQLGESINFDLDPDELAAGEADGTGIPINGIEKRGKELKVFVQLKKAGGVRIAGISIGNYDSQWNKLFKPIRKTLEKFKNFLLITDGDSSILKGLGDKVKVIYQRCLWHIPHQFKWYLWKDGVKRKSDEWIKALSELINICNTKSLQHDKDCIDNIVKLKISQLERLILYCKNNGWKRCTSYLENAKADMFTSLKNRLDGKSTSHVERVMRTVNMRANVGKWNPNGVLNAMKIRLAYYYNNFNI